MLASPIVVHADQGRGRGLENKAGAQSSKTGKGRSSRILDPATVNGYDEGFDRGRSDARDGDRYDPVRHRDYRDADRGYLDAYGSMEGYRTNFRTGFRQGYEDGYREGTRTAR
jgi:flagellar biosynthesis/type III secretory pathway protein FliH